MPERLDLSVRVVPVSLAVEILDGACAIDVAREHGHDSIVRRLARAAR